MDSEMDSEMDSYINVGDGCQKLRWMLEMEVRGGDGSRRWILDYEISDFGNWGFWVNFFQNHF